MNVMKSMIIAGALGAVMASPALAQRQGIGENAPQINTPAGATHSRTTAIRRGYPRSAYRARAQANPGRLAGDPRAEALRECTEDSRKWTQPTWGTMELQRQRACMMSHGQPE